MKIKTFIFPIFEEWHKDNCEYLENTGDYYVRIATTSWSKDKLVFRAAISTNDNPLNLWAKTIDNSTFAISLNSDDPNYMNKLKEWYEETCQLLNQVFLTHIKESYLTEENNE